MGRDRQNKRGSASAEDSGPLLLAGLYRSEDPEPREAEPAPAPAPEPAPIPVNGWTSGAHADPEQTSTGGSTCRARSGDSILSIAQRHGVSVRDLLDLNRLDAGTTVRPGQILSLPRPPAGTPDRGAAHRVKAGETLRSIARRHGLRISTLQRANAMGDSTVVVEGELLKLTGTGAVSDRPTIDVTSDLPAIPARTGDVVWPEDLVHAARVNKRSLLQLSHPSREECRELVRATAKDLGVPVGLAIGVAQQESGFSMLVVSPGNAVGVMQVTPDAGRWAAGLIGRALDLLDARDNIAAGVAILRELLRAADDEAQAIAGYCQGLGSVRRDGVLPQTRRFVSSVQAVAARYGSTG